MKRETIIALYTQIQEDEENEGKYLFSMVPKETRKGIIQREHSSLNNQLIQQIADALTKAITMMISSEAMEHAFKDFDNSVGFDFSDLSWKEAVEELQLFYSCGVQIKCDVTKELIEIL